MSEEWKKPGSLDDLKDTEIGSFLEKIERLKEELEGLIEKDKAAIRKVEAEVSKILSQKQGRVKDDQ